MSTRTADTLLMLGALAVVVLGARWAMGQYRKRVERREDKERARRFGGGER